jgi:monoamine oxidase
MNEPTRVEAQVVVVGAGFAGLMATRRLVEAGRTVAVVEARDRVGGRAHTETLADGTVLDMGGQWTGPCQPRIQALARELGVGLSPQFMSGENVIALGPRIKRYTGNIPDVGVSALVDFGVALKRLDLMARAVPVEAPWAAPKAHAWDAQTVETWARRNLLTKVGRELFRLAVRAVWACEPGELSLLHLLFYVRAGVDWDTILEFEGGAQEHLFVEGAGVLAERLAARVERVQPGCLHLAQPVRRLRHGDDGVRVETDGLTVLAERAIVAIPPTLAGRIAYDPPLPGARDQLTQRIPQGSVFKCFAIYERPFWRTEGRSGHATALEGDVQLVYDASPPDERSGVLMILLEGAGGRRLAALPADARRRRILDALARLHGPQAGSPRDFVERNWADEEFTRGCYAGIFPPGTWTALGEHLRRPVGRIHWAGTETATEWCGYFEGALQSGERAAAEVLALTRLPAAAGA